MPYRALLWLMIDRLEATTRNDWSGYDGPEELLDATDVDRTADLDPARIALLKEHRDEEIRERARELFAGTTLGFQAVVFDPISGAATFTNVQTTML